VITHNRFTLLNRTADSLLDLAHDRGIAVCNAAPYGSGILAVLLEGDEPEGELRHLDGEGVDVHAVEAVVGDELHRPEVTLFGIEGEEVLRGVTTADAPVRGDADGSTARPLDLLPGLDQAIGEVAAGLDQESAGAHGGVADGEAEDRGGRAQSPLGPGRALGGTDVDEGVEGVLDDGLGE